MLDDTDLKYLNLSPAEVATLKLHGISIEKEFEDVFLYTMIKDNKYFGMYESLYKQWDLTWDDDLDANVNFIESILGPDSAY